MGPCLEAVRISLDAVPPMQRQESTRGGGPNGTQIHVAVVEECSGQRDRAEGGAPVADGVSPHSLRFERSIALEIKRRSKPLLDVGIEGSWRAHGACGGYPELIRGV